MDIVDVLIRSVTGYLLMLPGLMLYFWCLMKRKKEKQTWVHLLTVYIFCYYLMGIWTMTGIHAFKSFSPVFTFLPFVDMIHGPVDTVLNVILFIPLGLFLPLLYEEYHRLHRVALTGLLLSLLIESAQMFGMGITDINDLITNTAGACLGYGLFAMLSKCVKREWLMKCLAHHVCAYRQVLFFVLYSFALMISLQPHLLHAMYHPN